MLVQQQSEIWEWSFLKKDIFRQQTIVIGYADKRSKQVEVEELVLNCGQNKEESFFEKVQHSVGGSKI